ncbi:hypothetical protein EGR_00322 [Echinococcus granulosus]|uniref:Uncharacterized protein n=1 Tax=Echinococcus granulosus TaxID=6210 RepID=W6UUT9_ECHGR|nr:hypothetical protein EGR_00322 [Echinococcus granulosus]EUB65053.1 hypothetical protein EGR_00322 [Echinococcus granulosus]
MKQSGVGIFSSTNNPTSDSQDVQHNAVRVEGRKEFVLAFETNGPVAMICFQSKYIFLPIWDFNCNEENRQELRLTTSYLFNLMSLLTTVYNQMGFIFLFLMST